LRIYTLLCAHGQIPLRRPGLRSGLRPAFDQKKVARPGCRSATFSWSASSIGCRLGRINSQCRMCVWCVTNGLQRTKRNLNKHRLTNTVEKLCSCTQCGNLLLDSTMSTSVRITWKPEYAGPLTYFHYPMGPMLLQKTWVQMAPTLIFSVIRLLTMTAWPQTWKTWNTQGFL